jgi:hypothetical protein
LFEVSIILLIWYWRYLIFVATSTFFL